MSDNVVQFRRIEKKPEKPPKKDFKVPNWLPWVVLIAAAVAITAWQQLGLGGGPPA